MYKVNHLHLHLTDDQGWRIAVDSWPRLTDVRRRHRGRRRARRLLHEGRLPRDRRRTPARRFMTVVPEVDLPGHTNAALASYAGAQLRWGGAAAVHRHRRRLQLAVRGRRPDLPIPQRCPRRTGRPHARSVPAHRRRRGDPHEPGRLRDDRRPGRRRSSPRTARPWSAGTSSPRPSWTPPRCSSSGATPRGARRGRGVRRPATKSSCHRRTTRTST